MTSGLRTIIVPVSDLTAAKQVYAALLGSEPVMDEPYYVQFHDAGQEIVIPVKNGEGNFVASTEELDRLEGEGLVVARYLGSNPNGSARDIAAIRNARGNVVGIMPHPEHAVEDLIGTAGTDGLAFFTSVLTHLVGGQK